MLSSAVAGQTGAAILATPMPGTVKRAISDGGCHTVDRRDLWIALTPQVFKPDVLRQAYASIAVARLPTTRNWSNESAIRYPLSKVPPTI